MLFKHTRNHVFFAADGAGGEDPTSEGADSSAELTDGTIVFSEEEANLEVPPEVVEKIKRYVFLVEEQHKKLLNALEAALANFQTTMSFASAADAKPDVLGVLASKAFDYGVGKVSQHLIPGFSTVTDLYDATTAELERASNASLSLEVGTWIKEQRSLIENRLLKDWNQNNRDLLQSDIESDYLERDLEGRNQEFFEQLHQSNERLSGDVDYTVEDLEAMLYEQWINAHFINTAYDGPGCIEYELEYADEKFEFRHCKVQAPSGDNIDTALNQLLDSGQLANKSHPIDFKVRKRVCIQLTSGSWECSWLDQDNNVILGPTGSTEEAQESIRAFNSESWRLISTFFDRS